MQRKSLIAIALFYLLVGPGPILFFLNQYALTLVPPAALAALIVLYRREMLAEDWNGLFKSRDTYRWMLEGIKYGIYAHALNTLIIIWLGGSNEVMTDELMFRYPVFAIWLVVVGSVFEEVVYRKIMFGWLSGKMKVWIAASLSSALFAAGHMAPERFFAYFAIGLLFCWIYRRSGSIVPSMLAHMALNLIAIMAAVLRS